MIEGRAIPGSVRVAAGLLVVYGVLVVGNALLVGQSQGFTFTESIYPRPVIRLAGTILLATGLLSRARWAWWLALILGGFWFVAGVFGMVVLQFTDSTVLPPSTRVIVPINALLLGTAVFLLFRTRSAFLVKAAD